MQKEGVNQNSIGYESKVEGELRGREKKENKGERSKGEEEQRTRGQSVKSQLNCSAINAK